MSERFDRQQYAFNSFCKILLRNEVIDAHREQSRLTQREVVFTELSTDEELQLQYTDIYAPERRRFCVAGMEVPIEDGILARALASLSPEQAAVILLAYILDFSDSQISRYLGLARSTVQYRRTQAIHKLRKLMEDYEND